MRKITKQSLDELALTMSVIPASMLNSYMGGYDPNDCFWRCMAYAASNGVNYGADAAMALASQYYGSSFNSDNYAFKGTKRDAVDYVSRNISSNYSMKVLCFNPSNMPGWTGVQGISHAIIISNLNSETGKYTYYDPQSRSSGTITAKNVNDFGKWVVNIN